MSVRSHLTRFRLRMVFLLLILLSSGVLLYGSQTGLSTATPEEIPQAEPRDGHTVVTESGRAGTINAYEPGGSLLYYNNSRTKYFDVDPVEGEKLTVEYTATDTLHSEGPNCENPPCARNVVERANLSTGETEVIYQRYDYKELAGEWHDHVRINDTHILIADIVADQVFIVNTDTEIVTWLWDAQSEFPVKEGGSYPTDWAHINDVSLLNDGRVMVSLRNQDQVVFIDPETGMDEEWTLGSEDNYSIMYEQHNPDYIPAENGGPAIVVADSENGRVQEFQRRNGGWERTWEWADERMQWPRDADRLPNGNTLIADTHGKRIFEVNPSGEIVWEVPMTLPYDVERLETGDESTGGQSAAELRLKSRTSSGEDDTVGDAQFSPLGVLSSVIKSLLPHRVVNGILYVTPAWMGQLEFAAATLTILTGLSWIGVEVRWQLRARGLGLRSPVYRQNCED